MHFVEYDAAHYVGCLSSGSCSAEIVASENAAVRVEVVVSADVGHAVKCPEGSCEQYLDVQK